MYLPAELIISLLILVPSPFSILAFTLAAHQDTLKQI